MSHPLRILWILVAAVASCSPCNRSSSSWENDAQLRGALHAVQVCQVVSDRFAGSGVWVGKNQLLTARHILLEPTIRVDGIRSDYSIVEQGAGSDWYTSDWAIVALSASRLNRPQRRSCHYVNQLLPARNCSSSAIQQLRESRRSRWKISQRRSSGLPSFESPTGPISRTQRCSIWMARNQVHTSGSREHPQFDGMLSTNNWNSSGYISGPSSANCLDGGSRLTWFAWHTG